jgi:hypothetical protein
MAVVNITYSSDTALTWTDNTLAADAWSNSANFDNSSTLYVDVLVGGFCGLDSTTAVAGETINIYAMANYSDTATDIGGARDAAYGFDGLQVPDTDFIVANAGPLLAVIGLHATETTDMNYHWGPVSIAAAFGGTCPKDFNILIHNNTSADIDAGDINLIGITYTST